MRDKRLVKPLSEKLHGDLMVEIGISETFGLMGEAEQKEARLRLSGSLGGQRSKRVTAEMEEKSQ